jgi:hypothetical protein
MLRIAFPAFVSLRRDSQFCGRLSCTSFAKSCEIGTMDTIDSKACRDADRLFIHPKVRKISIGGKTFFTV